MIVPNFLIIGAAKAGTTALHRYLCQHPQVYLSPVKETCFFIFEDEKPSFRGPGDLDLNDRAISDTETFFAQFQGANGEKAIGEASVWYLYHEKAPDRIQQHLPSAKLIAVLRNPIDRAFSSYLMMVRKGRETSANFSQALDREEMRIREGWEFIWHYQQAGFYYRQLKRYFDRFPADQLKIYLYEDFKNDPISLFRDLFQFLEIDPEFKPDMSSRPNKSGIPRSRLLERLLGRSSTPRRLAAYLLPGKARHRIRNYLSDINLHRPEMAAGTRGRLIDLYRRDIESLQDLIGRDLSSWLKNPALQEAPANTKKFSGTFHL